MDLSEDTLRVLEFLDFTSSQTLRKREDLGIILETLATNNKPELANEIIFYGSALWGTYRILKKQTGNDLTLNLKKEVEELFEKLNELITQVVEFIEEEEIINRFNKVYLRRDIGARMNIIDLCYDLNELKKVQLKLRKK